MKDFVFAAAFFLAVYSGLSAESQATGPFETETAGVPASPIDTFVLAALQKHGIEPANLCSDEVFIRRVYLDVIGTLPEPEAARAFLEDTSPGKRAALIDALLTREEFADYWALKWCDVLRVKAEFPINLWPNAVQAYHRWIRDAIRKNMPYDQFARALLTSSGSNFREPPVNFYRAIQGRESAGTDIPAALAEAVALTFVGERTAKWPEARRKGMAAFFSRIEYKKTNEWKEEIIQLNPKADKPLDAVFPDGKTVQIQPEQDPRTVFANWLISPKNPSFARSIVNRVWAWLLGRGIIQEPDDIRPDNPPANPELLAYLEKELISSKFDLRHIYRLILNSRTYQQSSVPHSDAPEAEALFAFYPVRRLDAEVLIDALDWIGGSGENYSSAIPEPFTHIPDTHRTIALADGSITSPFLEMFGRPTRDAGFESERSNQPTDAQRLHLLNSTDVQKKIERSPRLQALLKASKGKHAELICSTYMTLLSRMPTDEERAIAEKYFNRRDLGLKPAEDDLAWALINTKEFLYRH